MEERKFTKAEQIGSRLLKEMIIRLDDSDVLELYMSLKSDPDCSLAFLKMVGEWRGAGEAFSLEALENSEPCRQKVFYEELINFVRRAGMTESDVYNGAMMDSKLWYRLRDNSKARTGKENILRICLILKLNYWETYYLVNLCGHGFTPVREIDPRDYVVAICVNNKIYDPQEVDKLLTGIQQPPLFSLE